jgi:hypothetical protein
MKDFKMAPRPDDMNDTGIHRLFGDDLKQAEALNAALQHLERVMFEKPNVAELFFSTNKRRDMQYDEIPVGTDMGFRCFDASKHDAESAFQAGEFGDGLTEEQAYVEWLHNTEELPPRRSRLIGLGHPEQPPESIPDEDVFEYDD